MSRSDQERRDDIRDEMLIDMARGIQSLLGIAVGYQGDNLDRRTAPLSIVGRLESHIEHLRSAK